MNYITKAVEAFKSITKKPELGDAVQNWLMSDDRNTGIMTVLNNCRNVGIAKETAISAIEAAYRVFDEAVGASEEKMTSHPLEIRRAADKVYASVAGMREKRYQQMVSRLPKADPKMIFSSLSHWGEKNFLHEDTTLMREFSQWCQDALANSKELAPMTPDGECDLFGCMKAALFELFSEGDNVVCGTVDSQTVSLEHVLENRGRTGDPTFTGTCTYGENRSAVKSIKYVLLEWDRKLDGSEMPENWQADDGIEKRSLPVEDMLVTLPRDTALMTFSFLAKFREIGVPVKAVTWSGNKSLHCLIPIEAIQITEGNAAGVKRLLGTLRAAVQWLGCDSNCVSWGRLTRLPFGMRYDAEGNTTLQLSALYNDMAPIKIKVLIDKMTALAEEIKGCIEVPVFSESNYVTADEFDRWVASRGKCIATNMLSGLFVYDGWPPCYDQDNVMLQTIRDELRAEGQKISDQLIKNLIRSVGSKHAFNPVQDYLESLAWDHVDRIPMILEALGIDPDRQRLYATMVIKWLLQAVAVVYNDGLRATENVLTLVGAQGSGKTTFFRMLTPEEHRTDWFLEGHSINMKDKDSKRLATISWITELGEVDDMLKYDQTALKAFLSNTNDKYREPFAPKMTTRPRWTVFGATVNSMTFLQDQTGNRRWLTVPVDGMDIVKVRAMGDQIDQIWAQFKAMWDEAVREGKGWSCFRLSDEEMKEQAKLNEEYTSIDPYKMMVNDSFNWSAPADSWADITGTDVLKRLSIFNFADKRKFLNALREVALSKGIKSRKPGNIEKWRLPPFSQGAGTRNYW